MSEPIEITEAAREATNQELTTAARILSGFPAEVPCGFYVQSLLNSQAAELKEELNSFKGKFFSHPAIIEVHKEREELRSQLTASQQDNARLRGALELCPCPQPCSAAGNGISPCDRCAALDSATPPPYVPKAQLDEVVGVLEKCLFTLKYAVANIIPGETKRAHEAALTLARETLERMK